ncbi:helix-turn-helix domain-containing protein [Comamonas thiooxydans]|uniref:helix-turn-helix domain-containing protein n=1 Tax=Comamonas thiooxydans TaxID=363952 RepID=UPI000B40EBF9|nr:hypothetical protein [Comamonas thiooxydans]
MSQFDKYIKTEYVEALRIFLGLNKKNFLREAGFIKADEPPRQGRLGRYEEAPIIALEVRVNAKAARAEANDTTLGERFCIARDYMGMTDASVARAMGISREMVRRWGSDEGRPSKLPQLAELLGVPEAWLEYGGEAYLPANSHVGVRVGQESKNYREQLFGLTQSLVAELPNDVEESYAQAYIELAVFQRPELSQVARRAGGRWQVLQGNLLFSPWVPIVEHGLARRFWSDEVEAIIQEELANQPSVYAAWNQLKARCEALGMNQDQYPRRISLHKRIEKERQRAEEFGVDLNDVINAAVDQHVK